MPRFSKDVDILKCEPALFGELHLPQQVVASGSNATLSGTTLTAAGADFLAAGIGAGHVIHLLSVQGSLNGAYEIVSADGATQLTVSVLRADTSDPAIALPAANDVTFRVCTFGAQAGEAAFQLTEHFGIRPGHPTSEIGVEDLVGTEGLRRAAAFGVIAALYTQWTNHEPAGEGYWRKSRHYQQLFEEARQRCRLSADLGADGMADLTRVGGAVRWVRD